MCPTYKKVTPILRSKRPAWVETCELVCKISANFLQVTGVISRSFRNRSPRCGRWRHNKWWRAPECRSYLSPSSVSEEVWQVRMSEKRSILLLPLWQPVLCDWTLKAGACAEKAHWQVLISAPFQRCAVDASIWPLPCITACPPHCKGCHSWGNLAASSHVI